MRIALRRGGREQRKRYIWNVLFTAKEWSRAGSSRTNTRQLSFTRNHAHTHTPSSGGEEEEGVRAAAAHTHVIAPRHISTNIPPAFGSFEMANEKMECLLRVISARGAERKSTAVDKNQTFNEKPLGERRYH